MPISNLPGGSASYGIPLFGQGSVYDMPCGNVWFVCNRTGAINGDGSGRDRPMLSIADAVARVLATNGTQSDVIYVLSGHVENVTGSNTFSGTSSSGNNTGAQTIQRGVRIIGQGSGTSRPTITLTAAGSTIALANADSTLENFIIQGPQTGTTTVAAMVTVTAAGCMIRNCQFQMSSSATALATTAISLSAAAADCNILDCTGYTITGTPTSWLSTTGTIAPARVNISRNTVRALLSSATGGVIDFTAASGTGPKDWLISDNQLSNLTAASSVVIKGSAAGTGHIAYNNLETVGAAAATAITTPGTMVMFQNFVSQAGKSGIVTTTGGSST